MKQALRRLFRLFHKVRVIQTGFLPGPVYEYRGMYIGTSIFNNMVWWLRKSDFVDLHKPGPRAQGYCRFVTIPTRVQELLSGDKVCHQCNGIPKPAPDIKVPDFKDNGQLELDAQAYLKEMQFWDKVCPWCENRADQMEKAGVQ